MKGNIKRSISQTTGRPRNSAIQEKLARLGIADEFDLVLHLPLRYEDETHLYPIRDLPAQKTAQVEGIVIDNKVMYRPRRQLVCRVDDGSGVLCMRFLNFYGSQVKTYAIGTRVRLGTRLISFFIDAVRPDYSLPSAAICINAGSKRSWIFLLLP